MIGKIGIAGKFGDAPYLKDLAAKEGADPSAVLRSAAAAGDLDLAENAVKCGAKVNMADESGFLDSSTALSLACQRGQGKIVAFLCSVESVDKNDALKAACRFGLEPEAAALIKRGAKINARRCRGAIGGCHTPLSAAASYGHPALVKLLLKHKAGVDFENCYALLKVCSGIPCLKGLAHEAGCAAALRLLLKAGAKTGLDENDYHYRAEDGHAPCDDPLEGNTRDNIFYSQKNSGLHRACEAGLVGLVRVFIEHGADVQSKGAGSKMTPLQHVASSDCKDATEASLVAVVHLLLARGAGEDGGLEEALGSARGETMRRALQDRAGVAEEARRISAAALADIEARYFKAKEAHAKVEAELDKVEFARKSFAQDAARVAASAGPAPDVEALRKGEDKRVQKRDKVFAAAAERAIAFSVTTEDIAGVAPKEKKEEAKQCCEGCHSHWG